MTFLFLSAVGIAMLFFYKKAKAKMVTATSEKKSHIPRWAMPSEFYGDTYNPGNTTTFTGNESPAVPTVPSAFESKINKAAAPQAPTINPEVEITMVVEAEEETAGMENILTMIGVTKKETNTPNVSGEEQDNVMHNQSFNEVTSQQSSQVQDDQLMSYKEAKLDDTVTAFATNILGIQSITNTPELENNTLNNQSTFGDRAAQVSSVLENDNSFNDEETMSDYKAYLMSLNQPTQFIETDEHNEGDNVMTNNTYTAQSKEDKQFFATVHTNLLEVISKEPETNEVPKLEPIVLTAEDWFNGEHEQYVEISARYEEFYSHKIIEAASGMQTWVVQILGQQNEYIHVSDGTARIWLDVSNFAGKPMGIGSLVMVEVVCAEGKIQVETYSLLESLYEDAQVKWNQIEVSEYDYESQLFEEYDFEEKEQFVRLA